MKKSILLAFIIATLGSCNQDGLPLEEQNQEQNLVVQNRAPEIPDPVIIGDENTGCVVNIIFLAEGFTDSEMTEFKNLCDIAKQAILDMEPFTTASNNMNFYRVDSPSRISGIKTKEFTSTCNGSTGINTTSRTPWAVYGNREGLQHYAGMEPWTRNALEQLYGDYATGDYAYTIIIANTTEYYGGAEFPGVPEYISIFNPKVSNMIVSKYDSNAIFKFLVRHEFGHSFGNLDDEYVDAETNCSINAYESWFLPPTPKRNVLTYDPGSWFEGARYVPTGYWREWDNSLMRNDYGATVFSPRQNRVVRKRLKIAIDCL